MWDIKEHLQVVFSRNEGFVPSWYLFKEHFLFLGLQGRSGWLSLRERLVSLVRDRLSVNPSGS